MSLPYFRLNALILGPILKMSSPSGEPDDQNQPVQDDSLNVASLDRRKFRPGQLIFCNYNEVMYEARIISIDASAKDGPMLFLVHYVGWNKKWDEWVTEQVIAPYSSAIKVPVKRKSEPENNSDSDEMEEEEEDTSVQPSSTEVRLPPSVLEAHLADDQVHFKKEKKLKVPVAEGLVTIDALLEDYAEARRVNPPPGWSPWSGILVANQTRLLFNGFCHRLCLTDVEMLQTYMTLERHKSAVATGEVPKSSKVEGCDQLLAQYDITPYHPVHHLVRLMMVAPTIFMQQLETIDCVAASMCTVFWTDLAEYINERIDDALLDDRYYVPITKEDIDFIPDQSSDNVSCELYFSKLAICKQKVDGERETLQATQQAAE